MDKHYSLAIDQGGQSSRVAVYDQTGVQLCCFSAACATQHYVGNDKGQLFIEQNGEEILAGIQDCLQKIILFLADDVQYIKAAGFAGQGSSLLCWDKRTGKALTSVLSWQDVRGESYLNHPLLSHQKVQELTGLRVSPHYGASKIRWCLDNNANAIQALEGGYLQVGPIASFIFRNLAPQNIENLVDPGHAQRTLLWNLHKNSWDDFLLDVFAIPTSILPLCKYHNSFFGELSLGNYKIPFTASARDQGASLFSQGLPDENAVYINIGTGAFIQRVTHKLQAPDGLLVSPLWLPENSAEKKFYAWEATVNGAASAIEFIQQETGLDINPDTIYQALELNPTNDCYFLNAIGGLSAPYWRTDLQSTFSENLASDEKVFAWLESVIFQITVNIRLMGELGRASKIYISGGLSNADSLCQKIADLANIAVYRYDNSDATLQGIAYLCAWPDLWRPAQSTKVFHPQTNSFLYKRFSSWQTAMENWLNPN